MEIMEDGNLMDRVHILIQRDLEYYKQKQKVLQESLCADVVGGRLDFPRHASFAAVKLVLWWEEEYVAAFQQGSGLMQNNTNPDYDEDTDNTSRGCGGVIKTSDPQKFVALITKSADELLKHLHVLTQEALDHADLTVLTGTIGAAALLRNCLWCYIQKTPAVTSAQKENSQLLQTSFKQYQEMAEALAERLLDLHCRLLSLYTLQDAESLDWESTKPFFESERGSFIVQMWWLYMEGTRENLWNTVPPKIAQRVFSGMLNETLTIFCVRYSQACPSKCRSSLFAVDISNILLCVTELLPAICDNAEELIGLALNTHNKIIRDIHAKCQELFCCLLLRQSPLKILHKLFRRGIHSIEFCRTRNAGPSPWFVFTNPKLFPEYPYNIIQVQDMKTETAVSLELAVLLIQPQPNWALILKVLLMCNCKVIRLIFEEILKTFSIEPCIKKPQNLNKCDSFLCTNEGLCNDTEYEHVKVSRTHANYIISAITHIILSTGNAQDILQILLASIEKTGSTWALCFDRKQVWNQKRPAWYETILYLLKPVLPPIITIVINAVQTGASMYQAMSIILACFQRLWDCIPAVVSRVALFLSDILPSDVHPIGNSVLLHILISALYSALVEFSNTEKRMNPPANQVQPVESSSKSFDCTTSPVEAIAMALAENLCCIDEDNKHTEEIEQFLDHVKKIMVENDVPSDGCKRVEYSQQILEILVSELMMTSEGKKGLKILHHFVYCNHQWLSHKLNVNVDGTDEPNRMIRTRQNLLYTMFHIKNRPFDQLLTGEWDPNWYHFLQIPMGLSAERIWSQISLRWEFRETDLTAQSMQDSDLVTKLIALIRQNS